MRAAPTSPAPTLITVKHISKPRPLTVAGFCHALPPLTSTRRAISDLRGAHWVTFQLMASFGRVAPRLAISSAREFRPWRLRMCFGKRVERLADYRRRYGNGQPE